MFEVRSTKDLMLKPAQEDSRVSDNVCAGW